MHWTLREDAVAHCGTGSDAWPDYDRAVMISTNAGTTSNATSDAQCGATDLQPAIGYARVCVEQVNATRKVDTHD
jgi:hypothetical protein